MKKIILKKSNNCIVSEHYDEDGHPDINIIDIMGTHILPTAFTESADLNEVVRIIKEKNKDCLVLCDIEETPLSKYYYVTISQSQGGPGYFRIHATNEGEARKIAFESLKRWAFIYDKLESIHILDRRFLGDL